MGSTNPKWPRRAGSFLLHTAILVAAAAADAGHLRTPSIPPEQGESDAPATDTPADATASSPSGDLETEESLARYQQLLQRRPFHGPAFNSLVAHYAQRGKLQELIDEYARRAEALPDDIPVRVVLARLRLRAGDAAAAAEILAGIGELPADLGRLESELLALRAEVYQRSGDNAAAEQMLQKALSLAASISERLRLTEALADLYLRDSRREDAVRCLNDLAAQFPDNYLHQRRIAEALAQRGLHDAAADRYRAMLPLAGAEVDRRCEVLRDLGQSLEKLNQRDEAIAAYVEAIGLLASDHWLQRDLHERVVGLYRAAGRLEDLAAYCVAQIKRAPEQAAMRTLLADVQAAMGKPEEGKQTLAEAVALFPKDLQLSQKRVEFLERLGDIEGASAEYQRAIGQHPDDSELYIAYGQCLANNRQVEAARNQWRHVLSTMVDDATLALRLGALFEAYELHDDAAEAYERAVQIVPRQPEPYTALSRLWLVRGESDKALAALERMGQANPDDGVVQAALAQALRNLGKTDEALAAITRACELLPNQIRNHQIRSELLVQAGRLEEALEVRRDIIGRLANPVQQAEAIATLVSMHHSAGRLEALKEAEERRLAETPGDVLTLLVLARIADAERDFSAARRHLETLLKTDPGNEPALLQLAKIRDAIGDTDAAVEIYQRLAQLHPARARQFYEAIVDLKLRYGDRAGAIGTLEKMVQADPGNAATLNAAAEQLVRMGDPERALGYFETSLRIQPDRHEVRLDYGKALADAGRLEEAMREFRAVATQRTDMDRAVEALGRLHDTASQLGLLEDLMDELRQQVEADPQNTLVARALAQLLIRELEYGQAMQLLDLVLRHNPRDVDLALGRAELLRRLARFEEAAEAYQRVLRFPQIDRDYVLGELGKTWFEAGQIDQARRLWRQIQHKLYAGSLLKNNGLLDEAISVFEEGIRLKPDDFALHRNLIASLEAAGRTDEALEAARRLLDLEPANTWNIERLAEAYLRRGDRASAAEVAARLFSAAVGPDKTSTRGGHTYQSFAMATYQATSAQLGSSYSWWGSGQRSNLDRGIQFFLRNGLRAELEAVLLEQITAQPDNASLKSTAADLFESQLGKPELALNLLRELETAEFPIEQQQWLGQCSQRDFMRIRQYNLIATKPALRDRELAVLEAKPVDELSRDQLIELAMIRNAQGNAAEATNLLSRAVAADGSDLLARGVLADLLVAAERFTEAEPHVRVLIDALGRQREQMQADMIERVRRDFVRALPLEFQLRVTEELLADIAEKWTLGQGWGWWGGGTVQAMGYLRAKLTLGTILAETGRMEEARAVWEDLAPRRGPDVDRWTMLGDVAQLHKQEEQAYRYYREALAAAKRLAGDPLLQQIYASSATQAAWYGEAGVDSSFNSIVEAFAKRDNLLELYDFLRDTDQMGRARRLAEQYDLAPALKERYTAQVAAAAEEFRASAESPLRASLPYFARICKLAELYDREGDWEGAQKVYEAYLADFPDELGLLTLLGEVAAARLQINEAIQWERKVLDVKARLARQSREWALRELTITPSCPEALGNEARDSWSWSYRWGRNRWSYGGMRDELDRTASWMRLARLHLAAGNTIAAGDAMQHAVAEAGGQRSSVVRQVVDLIQQRQLTAQMLPVLRTLAVYAPADERVQLAFSESLEAAGRTEVAVEVCNRMLRRGVSDLGVLAEIRRRIQSLSPESAPEETTLASLEAEAAADPGNLKTRLRLAKAYFYSLQVDRAVEILAPLAQEAPHLEDVHDLLVEGYTLLGEQDKLIDALKVKIDRTTNEAPRRQAQWRLVDELLSAGRTEEALATAKTLGSPKDPSSYVRIGTLLHYFGRHDEAGECFVQAAKRRASSRWGGQQGDFTVAQSLLLRGDVAGAAERILQVIEEQAAQQTQYGGVYALYEDSTNPFAAIRTLLVLEPALADELSRRIDAQRTAKPKDPKLLKLQMSLHETLGRSDLADALLEQAAGEKATDQALVAQLIDLAVTRKDFPCAIQLAERFIAQQPKPMVPPGVPPQYAGFMLLQSPRTFMICKLGDIYWAMGEKDKALETYRQIVDKKVDLTNLAYASICLLRGRYDEARELIDNSLKTQRLKPPPLLQLRALIAAVEGRTEDAFEYLARSAAATVKEDDPMAMLMGGGDSAITYLSAFAQRAGMLDRFAEFVRERIAKNPQDWNNYYTLARAYHDAGRPAEALAVLDQAAAISSLTPQALEQRLHWRADCGSPDELIPLYERIIEISESAVPNANSGARMYGYYGDSGTSSAQHHRDQLGDLLWDAGRREDAQRVWSERLSPQQASTHMKLGQLYRMKGDDDAARRAFQRAVELDPDSVEAHFALAEEAAARGDRRAQLAHMLEVFIRRLPAAQDQTRGYDSSNQTLDTRMHTWAVELARDSELSSFLSGDDGSDHAVDAGRAHEYRVMLAALAGDSQTLESLLRGPIEAGTFDPLTWKLWAQLQQRRGNWAEAARALDFLRRARLTSISNHRDQLRLVLAGKQLKEAAAGTRQANPAGGAQAGAAYGGAYYGGYSYYYDDYYSASTDALLPSLYVKLGDYQRAERLYLLSSGGRLSLPSLAQLMWEQKARDRALELMRLALVLTPDQGGYNLLTQYTAMLSEAGRTEDAAAILTRAYRWWTSTNRQSMYDAMWGGGERSYEFEEGYEQSLSQALYENLKRTGAIEPTLRDLVKQSAADPADARLAKLIISLQKHDRRWADLRDSLAAACAARPWDLTIRLELFRAECQLGRWDEALAQLDAARRDAPELAPRWAIHEAFVRLMQRDPAAAVAAIEPLLEADIPEKELSPGAVPTVLAAAGRHDLLADYLLRRRASGQLDPARTDLLARALMVLGRWDEVLALATDELWKSQDVLSDTHPWYRTLVRLVGSASAAGVTLSPSQGRPADAALLTLITQGPEAGRQAFAALAEGPDAPVEALRGFILAATLAGDAPAAAEANGRLLAWLEPRRREAWYARPGPEIARIAAAAFQSMGREGATASVLGGSLMYSLSQTVQSMGDSAGIVVYDQLWRAHQRMHNALLAHTGDIESLRTLVRTQTRTLQDTPDPYGYRGYSARYYGGNVFVYGSLSDDQETSRNAFGDSWQAALRRILWENHRFDDLFAEYAQTGPRTPQAEWSAAAEAAAAAADANEATRWRRRIALTMLANLRSTSVPQVTQIGEYRYWYGASASRDVWNIRSALNVAIVEPDSQQSPFHGSIDEVWEFALADPIIERELLACESEIAPGTGPTPLLRQLVSFHQARKEPGKVIELIERAVDADALLGDELLSEYVRACYAAKDAERIDRILAQAATAAPGLDSDIAAARLVVLRLTGRDHDADQLERTLLEHCVIETPNPCPIDPRLHESSQGVILSDARSESRRQNRRTRYNPYGGSGDSSSEPAFAYSDDLPAAADLADALQVRFDRRDTPEALSLADLRQAYQRAGLHAHAARLLAREAAEAATPRQRWTLLHHCAIEHAKAGDRDAAGRTARELEAALLGAIKESPADSDLRWRLADLYLSDAFGPDFTRAADALAAARAADPACDPVSNHAVHCLYKLGKHREAWEAWRAAAVGRTTMADAAPNYESTSTLYYAAISACRAGQTEAGLRLARLALHRDPLHELADQTRELINAAD